MSEIRPVAIHEAGHAAMAYCLGRPFTEISVVEDGDTLGHVATAPPGSWFRPDIETSGRTRRYIEDRVMIALAGAETEAAWCRREGIEPPDDPDTAATADEHSAVELASYQCGPDPAELWFAESPGDPRIASAKAICATCPVRSECLAFARLARCKTGVWGGLTPLERRRLARAGKSTGQMP
jgi:WhiB family redox-sensing transcriptional regulator